VRDQNAVKAEQLKYALEVMRTYARHEDNCRFTGHPSTEGLCSCGFDDALKLYREAVPCP
jgi:hypothetical protein